MQEEKKYNAEELKATFEMASNLWLEKRAMLLFWIFVAGVMLGATIGFLRWA